MRFLLCLVIALGSAAAAAPPARQPVNVGGRAVVGADGTMSFGWPGVYFESRFRGTGVRVRFEAASDHLRLLVDGQEKAVFRKPGQVDFAIGGLAAGDHVVRLEKLTESQSGGSRFIGFSPYANSALLPAQPRSRQIEFIGDSYTVGYGNTSPVRTCTREQVHDLTDTQQAFGPLVARRFDADYRINAYSGFGIVRNYGGGDRGLSLPAIYPRLKPDDPRHTQGGNEGWDPQVIVINLGTNDFSTPLQQGEPWSDQAAFRSAYREAYAKFVLGLHASHPGTRFILMGSDAFFDEVKQVAATLDRRRVKVTAVHFGGLELTGCDWHPSLADNRRMAALIQAEIDRLDIWPASRS